MTTYDKIWASAMRSISARMVSRAQLARKLEQKFPGEGGVISQILDEMERVELLNDKRYTEQLISHLTQRPIGRMKIMLEAKKRGLDPEAVKDLLLSLEYNEETMVKKAIETKEKTLREEDPRKRKQKLMNFLRNRGFTDRTIYSGLRNDLHF